MATIALSAVGAAIGGSVGGGALGLSSVVIGRAIGATAGRAIDQRLMGPGSDAVQTGKVDRFRVSGASEGSAVPQIYGRVRTGSQVIWSSKFKETTSTSGGGGKGAPSSPKITEFSYTVSLALAVCEGEITRIGRIWADGEEISRDDLNLRVYRGTRDQMPDSKIEAVEGTGNVPGFRGVAYVVMEDLDLGRFGNRVPQFSFEVMRPAQPATSGSDIANGVKGVALIPGTGEYALATTQVFMTRSPGDTKVVNVNSPSGKTDFATSLESLNEELPNCGSVSMVVSWFSDDLRCDRASLRPKVEQNALDADGMPWAVSGVSRTAAEVVPYRDGRPVYGGTPTDQSVIEAMTAMQAVGQEVVFYPFILMDQLDGNGLPDPWTGAGDQPTLPWRGRMTLSVAPGQSGSPDQTGLADAEVDNFFGTAQPADFTTVSGSVSYNGPAEWSYRRFILHYAHLCAAAGGVQAFCIGSEMRGLTQIRGAGNAFPAVNALRTLAQDVRAILGPATKIGYAADWSEYFGYQPQDGSGDVFFHLDPLWADDEIDFVGIDNYMPLSDWRAGNDHADAAWGSIYNTDYLKSNIAGGEGFDWYYRNGAAELAQDRSPIQDGAYGEDWIFRYKDIKGWWTNEHYDRVGGVKSASATPWVPESKPIWFTEFGCAAVDKATNQPNRFLDPKSSESSLPKYSDGRRDDLIQMQYLRAQFEFWAEPVNNPVSVEYGSRMVDMSRAHVWAWDARPYPHFPLNLDLWSDGENYFRGHWLNGRTSSRGLADVVAEICERSGVSDVDVSRLYGYLRGYSVSDIDGTRAALQPLMMAFGFDAVDRDGVLTFANRDGLPTATIGKDDFALAPELDSAIEFARAPEAETVGRLLLNYVESDGDYDVRTQEAIFPDEKSRTTSQSEYPILMTGNEGRAVVERWLAESRVARETVQFSLPMSHVDIGAGDVVALDDDGQAALFRIDHVSVGDARVCEASRVEPEVYQTSDATDEPAVLRTFQASVPIHSVFMDLPLIAGDENETAPHLAVTSTSWPGSVAVYSSPSDSGYELNTLISSRAIIGSTQSLLDGARVSLIDRGSTLRVKLTSGALSSVSPTDLFNGANIAAIGDGDTDNWEIFQFQDAVLVQEGVAVLVQEGVYDLTGLLRGQAGTDALPSLVWPPGSVFVLLDGNPVQLALANAARGLDRHYRIGPATKALNDPSYTYDIKAFDGIGLRPYAPVHLRATVTTSGDMVFSWVRRTRIDGDSWLSVDVPLGEDSTIFQVDVEKSGNLLRRTTVSDTSWVYTGAQQASDGLTAPYSVKISQISARYGAGLFRRIDVNE